MLPTNMYYILLERSFYSTSTHVCGLKIHAEITEILQVTHSYKIVIFIHDIFFVYMSIGKFSYYYSHRLWFPGQIS